MIDKKKVIAWLADEELYYRNHGDTHQSLMACYALELLNEPDACENCAIAIEDRQPIVRYEDCKWYSEKGFCKHPNGGAGNIRPAEWFCADGERK